MNSKYKIYVLCGIKKIVKNLVYNQVSHILKIIYVMNQDHLSININGVVELI